MFEVRGGIRSSWRSRSRQRCAADWLAKSEASASVAELEKDEVQNLLKTGVFNFSLGERRTGFRFRKTTSVSGSYYGETTLL